VKELIVERSPSPEREETPPEQIREVETVIQSENVIELQEESSALHDDSSHVSPDYEVEIVSEKPPQTVPKLLRRKRPLPTFPSTFPSTRRRTRVVVAAEATKLKMAEIEIHVLRPLSPTVTQEPLGDEQQQEVVVVTQEPIDNLSPNQRVVETQEPVVERGKSQIHSLLFENDQLKREVQRLTGELEMLKEEKGAQRPLPHDLDLLVQATHLLGGQTVPSEKVETHETFKEYLCPECGDIYRLVGYEVTLLEPSSLGLIRRQEELVEAAQRKKATATQEPVAKEEEKKTVETPENATVTQEPVVPDLNMQSKKDIQEVVTVTQEPVMAKTVEPTQPESTTATQEPLVPNLNQQSDEATEEATVTQEPVVEEEELPQPDKVIVTQEPVTQAQIPLEISDEDEQEVDHHDTEDNTIFLLAEIDKWKQQGFHVWRRNDSCASPQKGNTGPQGEIH
jgi:hypothetical protein